MWLKIIMRKILSLITVIAFSSPLTSIVSSCSEKKLPYIPPYPIKETAIIVPDIRVKFAEKLVIDYTPQKNFLDDFSNVSKTDPITISVGVNKQIPVYEWQKKQIITLLNLDWSDLGGLVDSLIPYVSYKPVTIIYNQPTKSEMYLPLLGFTKANPRPFYIEGD